MRPREIFGIAVRIVGLIVTLYGAQALLEGILVATGLTQSSEYPASYWATRGAIETVVGLVLLRGAPGVVQIALSDEPDVEKRSECKDEG